MGLICNIGSGYAGQRYEVQAKRPPGDSIDGAATEVFVVGWTNQEDGGALVRMVDAHPSWHSARVFDLGQDEWERQPGDLTRYDEGWRGLVK